MVIAEEEVAVGEVMNERQIEGRRVYEGRVVSLEVDQVELDDGTRAVREAVRHHGAVVLVPLTADGRVLLVRQYRYVPGEALLELPAGSLNPGEDPAACAARELAEEIGHRAATLRPLAAFYSAPGFCDELVHCFVASDLEPVEGVSGDDDERIEVVAMPLAEAVAMARRGAVRDAKTIAGLLLAAPAG